MSGCSVSKKKKRNCKLTSPRGAVTPLPGQLCSKDREEQRYCFVLFSIYPAWILLSCFNEHNFVFHETGKFGAMIFSNIFLFYYSLPSASVTQMKYILYISITLQVSAAVFFQ